MGKCYKTSGTAILSIFPRARNVVLLLIKRQNLRQVQTERICRRESKGGLKVKFGLGGVENIVGKEKKKKKKNAGYHQHFLLFPQWLQQTIYTRSIKVVTVW